MLWIVLALLAVNATLIVWLACVAGSREERTMMAAQRLSLPLDATRLLQPVPVRFKEQRS